jgi:hypothetical protein
LKYSMQNPALWTDHGSEPQHNTTSHSTGQVWEFYTEGTKHLSFL